MKNLGRIAKILPFVLAVSLMGSPESKAESKTNYSFSKFGEEIKRPVEDIVERVIGLGRDLINNHTYFGFIHSWECQGKYVTSLSNCPLEKSYPKPRHNASISGIVNEYGKSVKTKGHEIQFTRRDLGPNLASNGIVDEYDKFELTKSKGRDSCKAIFQIPESGSKLRVLKNTCGKGVEELLKDFEKGS